MNEQPESVANQSDLIRVVERLERDFGGCSYQRRSESISVAPPEIHRVDLDLSYCESVTNKRLRPIAEIEDQFDSLLLVANDGTIYLWFINGECQSIEFYGKSLKYALAKALNTYPSALWLYRRRARQRQR